ncbi:cell wall-binding repeat-containing protein [Desulfitobacterium sp. AusDCA]|uniref:cell wall-binding repeat-containing protein n=1 Tax=Desulfitobacterium sp. AusDCA TaxID=3240383 RepID=UPI003DA6CE3E
MRKTKKALASLAIAGMVLSIAPMSVFGATDVTRLSDADRVGTAIAIAANGWTSADNVIVVPADDANIVDALAAAPLAGQLNAPILVTYKGALDPKVQQKIVDLKAKNVYAVGALSADTVASLKAISGVNVTALQGADRTETAAKVAAQLTNIKGSFVVAYNGVADAMSAASYAAANGYSILVENPDATLPASEAAYKGATQYTVGGQAKLDGATTLAGADRYATNDAVVNALDYKYDKVYVANGETLVDALAGASLAAKTNSPIVLADTTKAATGVNDNVTASTQVIALGGVGAVPEAVRASVGKTTPSGPVAVQSVAANTANSVKVVFANAVADTSKVTFKVSRGTTAVAITTTWNDAKTEATLTSSSNFPEDVYTVAVQNDGADLGSSSVQFTQQRVAKIQLDSTVLAITDSGKTGFVSYHAFDQYGNDITGKYLAGSSYIDWRCGIGDVKSNDKGLLTVTPFNTNTVLTQYTTAVITATTKNQTVPCSVTQTLNVSTQVGTISDISLNKLVTADGAEATPQVGDTDKYYIDYTAKDMAGNETKDKTLVEKGLITNNTPDEYTMISSNTTLVHVQIVDDPQDDTKAALEVDIQDPTDYTMNVDQPITITATTYTGKTTSFNFTLKRKQKVDSFTIMAPAQTISSGETAVEIPFAAYDQDGTQLTKWSDINGLVTFSPAGDSNGKEGLYLEENADGTASLKYNAPTLPDGSTTSEQQNLNATVANTGEFSSVSINVDLAKKADTLKLDDSIIIPRMETGAQQWLDFGFNEGGFQVLDQYDRVMNMTTDYITGGYKYYVQALLPGQSIDYTGGNATITGTPDTSVVDFINVNSKQAYAGHEVGLKATGTGSATVKFVLMKVKVNAAGSEIAGTYEDTSASKSLAMSVLDDKDITGYTLSTVANPIFAGADAAATAQQKDMRAIVDVYGTTSSGSKVALATGSIQSRTSSSSDFALAPDTHTLPDTTSVTKTATQVWAKKLDPSKSGSDTTISVSVFNGNDKRTHAATTTVKSTTDAQAAQSVGYYAQTVDRADSVSDTGISVDGSTVTVDLNGTQKYYATSSANFNAIGGTSATSVLNAIAGRDLTRFTQGTGASTNRGFVYIYAKDQYGRNAMDLANVRIDDQTTGLASIGANNSLQFSRMPVNGDWLIVTGTSTNGLVETIKIKFEGSTNAADLATAALNSATAAQTAYTTAGGSTGDAVYTAVTTAAATLTGDLSADPQVVATITADTATLNDKIVALNAAKALLGAPTPISTVNAATDAATMQSALENTNLGLVLTDYNKLTSYNKTQAAQLVLAAMPGAGFADVTAVQSALNTAVNNLLGIAKIDVSAIAGVTPPVKDATPVTTATATAEYTATVTWAPADATFGASTAYTATITITPKAGYTLVGVGANFFTVTGADTVTNDANSGVVTAVFPATGA